MSLQGKNVRDGKEWQVLRTKKPTRISFASLWGQMEDNKYVRSDFTYKRFKLL